MERISELEGILGEFLPWNKARLECLTKMLLALFAVRTVNLREIAVGFISNVKIDSRYKRLKRFFANFKIEPNIIAQWIFKLFFSGRNKIYLTVDRTNWFWGKSKINVLTLAVAYEGLAIPLFWQLLDKAGNATAKEHISILQRFVSLFGTTMIEGVLADREFASGELFAWLNQEKIPFYIRIKEDSNVRIHAAQSAWTAKKIFNHLNVKETESYVNYVIVFGQRCRLSASRSEKGELMIVATNQAPKNAISVYLRRWEIESFFQCLKGRGFRFEETHMTKLERIEKLMALLAIGFCWAHKVGEWRAQHKPIVLTSTVLH